MAFSTTDILIIADAAQTVVNKWGEYVGDPLFRGYDRTYHIEDYDICIFLADDLMEPAPMLVSERGETVLFIGDIENPEDSLSLFVHGSWIQRLLEEVEDLS